MMHTFTTKEGIQMITGKMSELPENYLEIIIDEIKRCNP